MAHPEAGWFTQPDPAKPPFPDGMSANYPAGLMLMQGILSALLARARAGRGQRVTTDLLSVAFHAHSWEGPAAMNASRVTEVGGVSANESIIDKSFATGEGYIEISPVFSENAVRDISTERMTRKCFMFGFQRPSNRNQGATRPQARLRPQVHWR